MFHTNHLVSSFYPREFRPSEVEVEARMDAAAVEDLRRRGNKVIVRPPWALGRVYAVGREADGTLKAGANPARHAGLRRRSVRGMGRLRVVFSVFRAAFGNTTLRRVGVAYLLFSTSEFGIWLALLVYAYGHGDRPPAW